MEKEKNFPQQDQSQPGDQSKMIPEPEIIREDYKGSEKLKDKVVLITGGDSGIGRSVAVHMAREGAQIAIIYLKENEDAMETKKMVEKEGQPCFILQGDLKEESFCRKAVEECVNFYGKINVLINNAAVQFPENKVEEINLEQVKETFETNIYPYFPLVKRALNYFSEGDVIVNTTSVTSYRGSSHLLDYSSSKGAITSFTRSLSTMLVDRKIRVNAVAPGPIWTPLIPSTFDDITEFGQQTPMKRAGQPSEVAPAYVFLACKDSSYITGQVIHVNGGELIAG